MSQKKVDAYKKEKGNRKQIIAKQRRNKFIAKIAALVVCAALVVWIGWSVITNLPSWGGSGTSESSNFDSDDLNELLSKLDAATDTDAE